MTKILINTRNYWMDLAFNIRDLATLSKMVIMLLLKIILIFTIIRIHRSRMSSQLQVRREMIWRWNKKMNLKAIKIMTQHTRACRRTIYKVETRCIVKAWTRMVHGIKISISNYILKCSQMYCWVLVMNLPQFSKHLLGFYKIMLHKKKMI